MQGRLWMKPVLQICWGKRWSHNMLRSGLAGSGQIFRGGANYSPVRTGIHTKETKGTKVTGPKKTVDGWQMANGKGTMVNGNGEVQKVPVWWIDPAEGIVAS